MTSSEAAEDVVARLRAGALSTNDALSLAVQFREFKHFNPAFGAIAAYLYDAAGDRDSIRRVAWFYPYMSQPIPFDVALLGGFSGGETAVGVSSSIFPLSRRERRALPRNYNIRTISAHCWRHRTLRSLAAFLGCARVGRSSTSRDCR